MTDTVYLVAWLGTGVVKAGYTGRTKSRARYRAHELRGATTLLRATFPTIGDAFAAEDALSSIVQDAATGPAFTDRDDARRSGLVADGGGWMECFSVPDELLGDVVARSEQCIRAMHPSNAREHCPSICIDPIHERTDERTHARSTPPCEQIWRSSYAHEGKQRMSDELDLDATVPMDVRAAKYDRIERDHPPRWWNRGGTASAVTLLHDWWGWFRR